MRIWRGEKETYRLLQWVMWRVQNRSSLWHTWKHTQQGKSHVKTIIWSAIVEAVFLFAFTLRLNTDLKYKLLKINFSVLFLILYNFITFLHSPTRGWLHLSRDVTPKTVTRWFELFGGVFYFIFPCVISFLLWSKAAPLPSVLSSCINFTQKKFHTAQHERAGALPHYCILPVFSWADLRLPGGSVSFLHSSCWSSWFNWG